MFPYFGRKATLASAYPTPQHHLVIEPFAGSMAYTLHHQPHRAIGIERDWRVVALWEYLCDWQENGGGIIPTPPEIGSPTDNLLVKLCSYSEHALTSGTMTVTSRMIRDWDHIHRQVLIHAAYARPSIEYRCGDYTSAPDMEATWFIDPPYQHANRRGYLYGGQSIDFDHLAEWCQTRRGQVIVCEQAGADWLPFKPLAEVVSHRGVRKSEVVWINDA